MDLAELAARIIAARSAGDVLDAPTSYQLDPDSAYAVQQMITDDRLARGGRIAGWKLGYTSAAMREQMGIADPNYGPLLDTMVRRSGAVIDQGVVHPRVEPEIAAVLARDVVDPDEAADAVGQWCIAIEVVDSVWRDYRFDWALNTADGSSAAYAVIGEPVASLIDLEVEIEAGGESRSGRADAAMGDPRRALEWLAERLVDHPRGLRAGDTIITGGLTSAIPLLPGTTATARADGASVTLSRAWSQ